VLPWNQLLRASLEPVASCFLCLPLKSFINLGNTGVHEIRIKNHLFLSLEPFLLSYMFSLFASNMAWFGAEPHKLLGKLFSVGVWVEVLNFFKRSSWKLSRRNC